MLTLESTKKELIAVAQEKGITANLERLNKTQILEMINEAPANAAAAQTLEAKNEVKNPIARRLQQGNRIPKCEMI